MDERLSELEEVVVKLREDVSNLKAFFSDVNARLNHLEGDVKELKGNVRELGGIMALNGRIDVDIKALNSRINSLLKWTVGLILGMWVTVMTSYSSSKNT
ncbi:MAG: hypothetical protein AOA65_1907 [Candidatus Bathyarchaeota archaeon BA1]|nr:MAG: hypothetical protein AOA65_1907 [Candidatus Bathyarchaeota archaeon BA1]